MIGQVILIIIIGLLFLPFIINYMFKETYPLLSMDYFIENAKDGDIILMKSQLQQNQDLMSNIFCYLSNFKQFNHIGIIYKGKLLHSNIKNLNGEEKNNGVHLVDLRPALEHYMKHGRCVIRKLSYEVQHIKNMVTRIEKLSYPAASCIVPWILTNITDDKIKIRNKVEKKNVIICSELVAFIWMQLGVLDIKENKAPDMWLPDDFIGIESKYNPIGEPYELIDIKTQKVVMPKHQEGQKE